jgi:hypothetical protein
MPKPTTTTKSKCNKNAYRLYEFSLGTDTKLNHVLERYLQNPNNSVSKLVRNQLADFFGIDPNETYSAYHLRKINHEWIEIPNNELDALFELLSI